MKFFQILAILLLSQVALNSAKIFVFSDGTNEFNIQIDDYFSIQHARDLISGSTTSSQHVSGRIIKSTAKYNTAWSYHLDPSTISFFDVDLKNYALIPCDASIKYIEDNLDEVGYGSSFLPGSFWCPWQSKIIREI